MAKYQLALAISRSTVPQAELERIAREYGATLGTAPVKLTVYPTGKRRKKIEATPTKRPPVVNGARPNQGALVASSRHKVDAGGGITMRQVDWAGFGTGAATRRGTDQAIHGERVDLVSTAPWTDEHDTTYRWDHSRQAYAHADHWPTLEHCQRSSAYGQRLDKGRKQRVVVPREYRRPRPTVWHIADCLQDYLGHGIQPGAKRKQSQGVRSNPL